MALNIIKSSKYVNVELLLGAAKEVFSYLGEEFEINIKFACKDCIHGLNKQYKGKDEPTNVLSFNEDKDTKNGDIVICEAVVEKEAKELKYTEKELDILYLVHGMLHLAGFDHEKKEDCAKMEKAEEVILAKLGVDIERG